MSCRSPIDRRSWSTVLPMAGLLFSPTSARARLAAIAVSIMLAMRSTMPSTLRGMLAPAGACCAIREAKDPDRWTKCRLSFWSAASSFCGRRLSRWTVRWPSLIQN